MTSVHRQFAQVNLAGETLNIHYRSAGMNHQSKTPMIILHPSPLSSAFMLPTLNLFAEHRPAIAMDTPGNGESDPLPDAQIALDGFVECLAAFLDRLGLPEVILYGNATGAQIAIEFAKAHPSRVERLILENTAWFYPEEHESVFNGYFPSLAPKQDGSHLSLVWNIANQLYQQFPWHDETSATTNRPSPPLDIIHLTVMDYLKAGKGYDIAYRAALNNEQPEQLAQVTVKTDILLWRDSIIYPYCARLLEYRFADNISIMEVSAGVDNRMAKLRDLCEGSD